METYAGTFSAREFVLAADDAVVPVGLVSGSSVYHVGRQWTPIYESAELTVLTSAERSVRRLAVSRLQEQAERKNAHGVLDVAFRERTLKHDLREVSAVGTAIRLTQGTPPPRPFLSTLSAPEFWTLRRAGYRPYGIAWGVCVFYHAASPALRTLCIARRSGQIGRREMRGQEYAEYTEAAQAVRQTALSRLEAEAGQSLAEGILDLRWDQTVTPPPTDDDSFRRYDRIVSVTAQGTTVLSHRDRWPSLDYAVPLTD